jgi:transcriptional regulator with XRE-family HTH domain
MTFAVGVTPARIHEYENGKREPNLLTLLIYAQVALVTVDHIINDRISLASFRDALLQKAFSLR